MHFSEEVNLKKLRSFMMPLQFGESVYEKSKKWVFTGSLDSTSDENLPGELYCFFKWIVQGISTTISVGEKSSDVNKRAVSMAQSTISLTLAERQAKNKKSEVIIVKREMPQQLGMSWQAYRSKETIKMLHGFGFSAEYKRLLRVEEQVEQHYSTNETE